MSKGFVRFVSMLLTLVMVFMLLPTSALAEYSREKLLEAEQELEIETDLKTEEESVTPIETASIVGENLGNRDRYQKEFYLDNGTNLIVVYPEPVHYETEEGWEEIDNTLVSITTKGVSMLTNKAGAWSVNLPQSMSANAPVIVSQHGYILSFALDNKSSGVARAAANETVKTAIAEIKDVSLTSTEIEQLAYPEATVETLNSRIEYTEVFDDVDLRYDLSSEMLKESIMINKKPTSQQSYTFNVAAEDISLELQDDGSIWAMATDKESDEPEFVIAAPYMVDANGELCYEVETTLTAVTNSTYKLTYTPSYSWLIAVERAYPVALDPTVEAELDVSNIRDVTVSSEIDPSDKNAQYHSLFEYTHKSIFVGKSNNLGILRTYLMYRNLPELSSADVIVNASVQMILKTKESLNSTPMVNSNTHQINVHAVNEFWKSEELTWEMQDERNTENLEVTYNPIIEDYDILEKTDTTMQIGYLWNITGIAQGWYEDENQQEVEIKNANGEVTGIHGKYWHDVQNDRHNRKRRNIKICRILFVGLLRYR